MKRSLLLVIAGLAASGCYSSPAPAPQEDVIVYWHFTHFDSNGANQPLTCAQAGVDYLFLQFSDGYSTNVPCSQLGVEGVTVLSFAPGAYSVQVTGYRNGVSAALYYGTVGFNKVSGINAVVDVPCPGIPGNLQVFPTLTGWNGTAYVAYASPQCTNGNVDYLTYTVRDGVGILLAQGQVTCAAGSDPPSILFTGASAIDKDDVFIRMQGFQTPSTLVMDSCSVSFPHFGDNDVGSSGAFVNLLFPIPGTCN